MKCRHSHTVLSRGRGLLVAALIGLLTSVCLAENKAEETAKTAASDREILDTILEELKAIRETVEKIEKQGVARAPQRPTRPTEATATITGKPVLGDPSAPVTVVEFADYQCPFCLRFIKSTFPQLKRDYIDTGKVRWVALNLPLAFHKDARKAAQAAHCAGEQDKFWEMREELFKNPKELAEENLPKHAARLGLDVEAFKACLASERHLDEIDQDAKSANTSRLTGTPSFIVGKSTGDKINGQVIIGAQPLHVFKAAIDKAASEATAEPSEAKKSPGAG
jgi:protein-disulfide isomerase